MAGLHARALAAALVLAALLAFPPRAGAQSKETLDTKVTGEGSIILLEWGKKHPWAAQLETSGPALLGEYRARENPSQVSAECFATAPAALPRGARGRYLPCSGIAGVAVGGSKSRTLRYRLPDSLTATPGGSVCLFFRMTNGKILPIRASTRRGEDTARFRYAAWDQSAAKRTATTTLARNVEKLRQDVAVSDANVAARKAANEEKGWTSLQQCQGYSEPTIELQGEDRPVAEPDKQDGVARLVCISRVYTSARTQRFKGPVTAESQLDARLLAYGIVPPPALLVDLTEKFGETGSVDRILSPERLQQFRQFAADWQTLSGLVDRYEKEFPRPHFGAFREMLDLQSITSEAGESILMSLKASQPLDQQQVAGYIGGGLEAYTRCVADGRAQLDSSYRRSVELKQSTPELQAKIRQELVTACVAGVNKLAELDATREAVISQLAREEAALKAASEVAALPSAPQDLNAVACAP